MLKLASLWRAEDWGLVIDLAAAMALLWIGLNALIEVLP